MRYLFEAYWAKSIHDWDQAALLAAPLINLQRLTVKLRGDKVFHSADIHPFYRGEQESGAGAFKSFNEVTAFFGVNEDAEED